MDENPTAEPKKEKPVILQPEVVPEPTMASQPKESTLPNPEPTVMPASPDTWSKFPPQVDRSVTNKPSRGLMWLVIILIAVAVAVVGLAVRQFMTKSDSVRTVVSDDSEPTPTVVEPTPTLSPTPEITDKDEVTIQVLNASGVTGRAGKVATALEAIDFVDVETGNSDIDDQVETVIEYSPKVDMKIIEEIIAQLKEMFTNVRQVANTSLEDYHVLISTGTDEPAE